MKKLCGWAVVMLLGAGATATAQPKDRDEKDPQADLIGKPAFDFRPDFAVQGQPASLAQLKNKVVLLDFWAVWCGPCIQTFPHLRALHAKYQAQGLEIVGLTTYYERVGFDKEAGKPKALKEKMTVAQEQAMLKEFAQHHKLDYRVQALSLDERQEVYARYGIRAIPTAVVIDRKGIIRLIKVGASEANARAIEETIQKLLADQ